MKFIQVTNLNSLYALQQHENEEVAYVQDIENIILGMVRAGFKLTQELPTSVCRFMR